MSTDHQVMRDDLMQVLLAHRGDIIAYLRGIGPADLAEDAFQETFLVVQRKLATYEERGSFLSWVRVIARQVMFQQLARRGRMQALADDHLTQLVEQTAAEHLDEHDPGADLAALRRCLQKLAPEQRRMLDLRYVTGLALVEIAALLGRSEGAVQVALSRLRGALAGCVEGQRRRS